MAAAWMFHALNRSGIRDSSTIVPNTIADVPITDIRDIIRDIADITLVCHIRNRFFVRLDT